MRGPASHGSERAIPDETFRKITVFVVAAAMAHRLAGFALLCCFALALPTAQSKREIKQYLGGEGGGGFGGGGGGGSGGGGFGGGYGAGSNAYNSNYGSNYGYDDYTETCYAALDVIAVLNTTDGLNTFIDALYASGLVDLLADPLLSATIFAPTDEAFASAAGMLGLSQTELLNSPLLLPILLYHILPAPLLTSDLRNKEILPTSLGQNLTVMLETSSVTTLSVSETVLNVTLKATESEATIVDANICNCDLCNSAVHVIDTVLMPQILSVQTNDSEVLITIGNGAGQKQYFLIIYEDLAPAPSQSSAALPSPASAPLVSSTGITTVTANSPSATVTGSTVAPSSSTAGQRTSAGTTYYTDASLNS